MTVATREVRVGTRASLLARTQTDQVIAAFRLANPQVCVRTVLVSTHGDRSAAPLEQLGGTGVFVSALRDALLSGEIDLAVHSYKDLPTGDLPGIVLAAVPTREDPRDALVSRVPGGLLELPVGARVGTGSPRRAAQLRALDLGLQIVPIRGNVDTRLARVLGEDADLDAVVLAAAGLRRLGKAALISELIDPIQVLPAAAQGALAIECRADDAELIGWLKELDDPLTSAAVAAERSLLTALEAGCTAPIGALAEVVEADEAEPGRPAAGPLGGREVYLRGSITAIDGSDAARSSASGPLDKAGDVGRQLAAELVELGATTMMGSSK